MSTVTCASYILIYDSVHSIYLRCRRVEDLQGSTLLPGQTVKSERGSRCLFTLCACVEVANCRMREGGGGGGGDVKLEILTVTLPTANII